MIGPSMITGVHLIPDAEKVGVPGRIAHMRGGLYLVELADGTAAMAFADMLLHSPYTPRPETDAELDELLDAAVERATQLARSVRGPHADLWSTVSALSGQDLVALVITLAAMVPAETDAAELLAWTDQLETTRAA